MDAASLGALADHVLRLNHDLGKYVSLQVRWLGEDPSIEDLRRAVEADLLSTRRGPDGSRSATSVWAEFRPGLVGEADLVGGARVDLSGDPDVVTLDQNMGVISKLAAALGSPSADTEAVERGVEAARVVAETCRSLARRVRAKGA